MTNRSKIIISGASRGLGYSLAKHFAPNNSVISFSRSGMLPPIEGVKHVSGIDVRKESHLDGLTPQLEDANILINNVGTTYDGILATQSMESVREIIDTNLISVLNLTKLYVRSRLKKRKPGVIITISSIIGIRGYSGLAAYSASKAGLDGMTRALAREMGPKGFRINSVLPGYFKSDLSKNLDQDQRKQIERRTPLGRLANSSDIVPVVDFLASDLSKFITGQSIVVDGGITV